MSELLERKVGIVSCSGEELAEWVRSQVIDLYENPETGVWEVRE